MEYLDYLKSEFKKANKVDLLDKYLNDESLNEDEVIDFLKVIEKATFYKEKLDFILKYENVISKRYYDFATYKISALLDNKEYEKAKLLILNELNLPYIPTDFESFLKSSLKEIQLIENESKKDISINYLKNLGSASEDKIFSVLTSLKYFNLSSFYDQFQIIFSRHDLSNSLKSVLLALLCDMKVDYSFQVVKNNKTYLVNPFQLKDFREFESFNHLNKMIADNSKTMSINEMEYFKMICEALFLDLYPEQVELNDTNSIFYAICKFLNEANYLNKKLKEEYLNASKENDKVEYYYSKIVSLF